MLESVQNTNHSNALLSSTDPITEKYLKAFISRTQVWWHTTNRDRNTAGALVRWPAPHRTNGVKPIRRSKGLHICTPI